MKKILYHGSEHIKEARRDYRRCREQSADVNDIYMLDIMREGITNGDQRLL